MQWPQKAAVSSISKLGPADHIPAIATSWKQGRKGRKGGRMDIMWEEGVMMSYKNRGEKERWTEHAREGCGEVGEG